MTQSAFGEDAFGRYAESAARFFGTPQYIVGQTILVALWITLNAVGLSLRENLVKSQNDELRQLLQANTDPTQQDKDLTESVAELMREIHAAVRAG